MAKFNLSGAMSKVSSTLSSAPSKINQAVSKGVGSFKSTANSNVGSLPSSISKGLSSVSSYVKGLGGNLDLGGSINPSQFMNESLADVKANFMSQLQGSMNIDTSSLGIDKMLDMSNLNIAGLENLDSVTGSTDSDMNRVMADAKSQMASTENKSKSELESVLSNPLESFKK